MEDETNIPNIALRAYELWDAAGRPEGRSDEFYFLAEEELRLLLEKELFPEVTSDGPVAGAGTDEKS
jgi:Protein of unknown function (DUF2934)